MRLTANQIKHLDEIQRDKTAIERTLNIALSFAANRSNEMQKEEREFWDAILDEHGLDKSKTWTTNLVDGVFSIVEASDV